MGAIWGGVMCSCSHKNTSREACFVVFAADDSRYSADRHSTRQDGFFCYGLFIAEAYKS